MGKAVKLQLIQASSGSHVSVRVQLFGTAVRRMWEDKLGLLERRDPQDHVMRLSLVWNSQPSPWMNKGTVLVGASTFPFVRQARVLALFHTLPEGPTLLQGKEILKDPSWVAKTIWGKSRATSSVPRFWLLGSLTGARTRCACRAKCLQWSASMSLWQLPFCCPKLPHLAMATRSFWLQPESMVKGHSSATCVAERSPRLQS